MKRNVGTWLFLFLLVFGLPLAGMAQGVVTVQSNRGWIGITFSYAVSTIDGEDRTVVVIDDVVSGSPAEEAGLRVGDTLTHLDGQPISQRVFSSLGTLEVGDLVRLTVQRDHRPVEILVEAGPQRPTGWVIAPNRGEMVVQLDSIRGSILQNLDSLRVHIGKVGTDSLGQLSISILEAPPKQGGEPTNFVFQFPRSDTLTSEGEFLFQQFIPLPFETLVVETEQTDSLKQELQRIRKSLTEVRRAELTRIREIQAGSGQNADELIRQDERVRELRTREERLVQQQAQTTQHLQRMTDDLMRQRVAEIQEEQFEAMARLQESQASMAERSRNRQEAAQRDAERAVRELYESRRPTSHIMVGQSFVAGAQLTPLNPALGEYFKVDQGVLVTEVLEGTPADNAGLQAGDVIVRVGSEAVASLEDLRFAVAYLDRPLRFRVIRKGNPVEIVIGK